jgi:hypothetical protein
VSSSDLPEEGRRLVAEAAARGFPLRLIGGVAIWLRASERARAALGRDYPDLDLVARRRDSRLLRDLLEQLGYAPERVFNATHGAKRLLYHAGDGSYHLDVFLDVFEMSHKLVFADRLELESPTLPAAELLLTKLQVAEVNRKDLSDAAILLWDHELATRDGERRLNATYLESVCGDDWGLYTTVADNLARLRELLGELVTDAEAAARVDARAADLAERLKSAPKSPRWRLRAKVGRRKRWYETPEEVVR